MCRSMADIQSTAAEIRRGKKNKIERRKKETTGQKYNGPLLHRAAIIRFVLLAGCGNDSACRMGCMCLSAFSMNVPQMIGTVYSIESRSAIHGKRDLPRGWSVGL